MWEAEQGGRQGARAELKELVKLRNQAAVKLGFKNFHALQLYLNEQNGDDLIKLFDELDDADARSRSPRPRRRSTPGWPPTAASSPKS